MSEFSSPVDKKKSTQCSHYSSEWALVFPTYFISCLLILVACSWTAPCASDSHSHVLVSLCRASAELTASPWLRHCSSLLSVFLQSEFNLSQTEHHILTCATSLYGGRLKAASGFIALLRHQKGISRGKKGNSSFKPNIRLVYLIISFIWIGGLCSIWWVWKVFTHQKAMKLTHASEKPEENYCSVSCRICYFGVPVCLFFILRIVSVVSVVAVSDTEVIWMRVTHFHSCTISRSESVCTPKPLHHSAAKGRMSHQGISVWAALATPTWCFFTQNDDVITRDFLNTGFIHRALLLTRDTAPNKPFPWQP